MFKQIDLSHTVLFDYIGFILLPLSYILLLIFALISLMKYFSKTYLTLFFISLLSLFFVLVAFSNNRILDENVWARYLIGAPAILFSTYVLFLERDTHIVGVKKYMQLLSYVFFAYAIFGTLIVPQSSIYLSSIINQTLFLDYIGVPVQLFRALSAFLAAYLVITLLKILREEMQMELKKLSKAIEVSGDSVMITDANGIIEYVNPAFEKETKYSYKESVGQKPSILKSGFHSLSYYEKLWSTLLSGESFNGYVVNKKKDGELYHEFKSIVPIFDDKGKIVNFVSTGKDITERVNLEKKLEKAASTDKLTGIANRMKFDEFMQYSFDRTQRYHIKLSLILFDIDDFKKINDTYGHLKGDYVLKTIAKIAEETIRKNDLIARWGGEEFMILEPDIPADEATILAERIRQKIENFDFDTVGKLTASFGVTTFVENDTIQSFLSRVDEAMYKAKTINKNKVVFI
ncbi:MAG: sensor domain-containing diguanylate cyclase [Thiovulaceae bacterium]|nr:sensor domain-containing diguanylate cyclase [Sulfurimonadaceae bacterium]